MTLIHSTISLYGYPFYVLDVAALVLFAIAWFGYAEYAEKQYPRQGNLVSLVADLRMQWMRQMLLRDNRVVDSTLIGNLLRSIAFLASTTIFILLGLFTLFGYREELQAIIDEIPFSVPSTPLMWEIKLLVLSGLFIYAFFKYTWSIRLYNYACIITGAAPIMKADSPQLEHYASHAGQLVSNAGKHFNMALRAYYYGIAAFSWFIHAGLFIVVTGWIVYIVHRREFRSQTVSLLSGLVKGSKA